MAYVNTKGKDAVIGKHSPKFDLHRALTDDKQTQHRTAARRLELIGTTTSPTSACLANMALHGKTKRVALFNRCSEAYAKIPSDNLSSLSYVPLNFDSIHLGMFSDGSFQNIPDKRSQVGYIFVLAEENHKCNLFHLHRSRPTRRPSLTKHA